MSETLALTLAMTGQIMDNGFYGDLEDFLSEAGLMTRDFAASARPVWGTPDKALLASLIERSRAGDDTAMESLYEMFKRPIFGLAYRHAMNRAIAEDLLQDVFVKIFAHIRDVRDAETFPAWVFRIALNTCYSYLREKKVRNEHDVSLTDVEGTITDERAEGAVESDLKAPLEQAIAALPPRLKSVFVLHDVQGWKHEEIARMLGCTVGTSKSQLFKARMRLRGWLTDKKIVPGESS